MAHTVDIGWKLCRHYLDEPSRPEPFYSLYFLSLRLLWRNMVGVVVAGRAVYREVGMVAAGTAVGMEGTDTALGGMACPGSGFMAYQSTGVIRSLTHHPHNRSSTNRLRHHSRWSTRRRHIGIMWFITQHCIAIVSAAAVA